MKKERTIKALAELKGKVYVYLSDEKIGNAFLQQAEKEGFSFRNGKKPSDRDMGYANIMTVCHDYTINYVVGWAGNMLFHCATKRNGNKKLIRIDYAKYIGGDRNYIFCKSNL